MRPTSIECTSCTRAFAPARAGKLPRMCVDCRQIASVFGEPWTRLVAQAARDYAGGQSGEHRFADIRERRRVQLDRIAKLLADTINETPGGYAATFETHLTERCE